MEVLDQNRELDNITCNLCKIVTTRRIKRMKEHLVNGCVDRVMCSKITTKVREEMRAYLEKRIRDVDQFSLMSMS
jgi:transposase-like protein